MRAYLIRHGETTGDIEDRYGGDYDDELTEEGRRQARALADQLKDKKIQVIFHSPRIRATQTAKIVSEIINVPTEIIEDIRERNNYGVLTGMVKSEAAQKHPEEHAKLKISKTYHDVEGSEHYEPFTERVVNAFKQIFSAEYDAIAIISHGGVISTFVREWLKLGDMKKLGDCAILELDVEGNQIKLQCLHNAELENKN